MKKHKNKYIMTEGYQKLINKLGFYRIHFGGYEEPVKSSTKIKYIRGQWIFKDAVIKMGDTIKDELRVITPISDENKATLLYIKKCNSVAVHIRRGDYVDLGLIVCDIEYYKRCMDKMAAMIEDPIFFIFSDDVNWVRENLITNHDMFFVNNNNSAPDDMRLMYSCKHFIMSNLSLIHI